jgi:hypothetical protein
VKLKTLLVTSLFVAGVAASVAVAKGPPPGKGKSSTSSSTATSTTSSKGKGKKAAAACKPTVSFVLKGEFAGAGAAPAVAPAAGTTPTAAAILGTFDMDVKQANRHGRKYRGETVTVSFDRKTAFKRRGHADLEDFEDGDWLNVQVRACHPKQSSSEAGASPAASEQPVLLAKRVVGKPAKNAGDASESETTTTTTTSSP